jgi:hypothetical protein
VVGNRIGAIRDAKGKSVGAVFMNLSAGDRAAVLVSGPVKLLGDQLDKGFISIMTSSCAASRILTATTFLSLFGADRKHLQSRSWDLWDD